MPKHIIVKISEIINDINVAKGKLLLVPIKKGRMMIITDLENNTKEVKICPNDDAFIEETSNGFHIQPFKPIIISEIENFELSDWVWDYAYDESNNIKLYLGPEDNGGNCSDHCRKLLALPENISPLILQKIIDGQLKSGDEVYIKCKQIWRGRRFTGRHWKRVDEKTIIDLDSNNHISLYNFELGNE